MDILKYIDSNLPCLCDSNKKIIDCCLTKKEYNIIRFLSFIFKNLNDYNYLKNSKCCINLIKNKNVCNGNPLKSHSISKTKYLSNIADENNEVNTFNYRSFHNFIENDNNLKLERWNIRNASTFKGLCSYHEKTYNPIDEDFDILEKENYYLMFHRQLIMDINSIKVQLKHISRLKLYIHSIEKNIKNQLTIINEDEYLKIKDFISKLNFGILKDEKEAKSKLKFTNNLAKTQKIYNPKKIKFLVFEVKHTLPFASSQILRCKSDNSFRYFSVLPLENKSLIIYLFDKEINEKMEKNIEIISIAFEYVLTNHNSFYAPLMIRHMKELDFQNINEFHNSYIKGKSSLVNKFDIPFLPDDLESIEIITHRG